ncbi:hypothetical protein [Streptomyces sp. MST-110588]|uniref:hypothetical protein n=1 Tax=Streptomyces sp. MST-110588 TaxID=2833628 RepID=UPI001F5DBEF3|nr:hypothetical protein [Streptomyces sp. MST-110588]UNO39331.1 hypothetical protein KGS77_06490 [Streptomyces sp. MST-110588]
MANVPVEPGVYILGAHIGFRSVLTPAGHAIDKGVPVITQPEMQPPLHQAIIIQPAGQDSYYLSLFVRPQVKIVYSDDKVFANATSPVPWTFDPSIRGLNIVSDKGLAIRADYPGAQLRLTQQEDIPEDTWSLIHLHLPIPPEM